MEDLDRGLVLEQSNFPGESQTCVLIGQTLEVNGCSFRVFINGTPRVRAAIQDRVRRPGPLLIVFPSLWRRPHLGAPIVFPARGKIVLFRPVHDSAMVRVNIEKIVRTESKLNDPATELGNNKEFDDSVRKAQGLPPHVFITRYSACETMHGSLCRGRTRQNTLNQRAPGSKAVPNHPPPKLQVAM